MKNILLYSFIGIFCFTIGFFGILSLTKEDTEEVFNEESVEDTEEVDFVRYLKSVGLEPEEYIDNYTEIEEIEENKKEEKEEKKKKKIKRKKQKFYIDNVDVTGSETVEDAVQILESTFPVDKAIFEIYIESDLYKVTFEDLGLSYDFEGAIYEALENTTDEIVKVEAEIKYTDESIYKIIDFVKENYEEDLGRDEIVLQNGEFIVSNESVGYKLDEEEAYKKIKNALDSGRQSVDLSLQETNNSEMLEDINDYMTVIGSYTTYYSGSSDGRITNLKVASDSLNGTVVYPDEVFSTNDNFAPYTEEKGYATGSVIVDGQLVDGIGGGVCQVSSTLYNALLYAELEIVERYNHSLKVGYLDYGFDAVLASTYKDLKFRNNTSKPVYIESYVGNGEVTVNIYGEEIHNPNRNLKFTNELVNTIEPEPPIVIENDDMFEGEEIVEITPLNGYEYNVYKHVYDGDTLISTELVDTSYYRSRQEQKVVGTKPIEQDEQTVFNEEELNSNDIDITTNDVNNNDDNLIITEEDIVEDFNDEALVANNEEKEEILVENDLQPNPIQ